MPSDTPQKHEYILTFHCPDRIGVVAVATGLLYDLGAFVTEISNYSDPVMETFHLRCIFDDRQMTVAIDEFEERVREVVESYEVSYHLRR